MRIAGEAGQQLGAMQNGRFLYEGGFMNQPIDTIAEANLYQSLRGLAREVKRQEKTSKPFDYSQLSELEMELLMVVDNGD